MKNTFLRLHPPLFFSSSFFSQLLFVFVFFGDRVSCLAWSSPIRIAGWPVRPEICLSPPPQCWDYQSVPQNQAFSHRPWRLNSMANTVLTELSPSSSPLFSKCIMPPLLLCRLFSKSIVMALEAQWVS